MRINKNNISGAIIFMCKLFFAGAIGFTYLSVLILYSGRIRLAGYHLHLLFAYLLAGTLFLLLFLFGKKVGIKLRAALYFMVCIILVSLLPFLKLPSQYDGFLLLPPFSASSDQGLSVDGRPRFSGQRIRLNYEVRPGMILPLNHAMQKLYDIPEQAELGFAVGIEARAGGAPYLLSVFMQDPVTQTIDKIYSDYLDRDTTRWQEIRLDLSKHAGKQRAVIVQVTATKNEPSPDNIYISKIILSQRTASESKRPNIVLIVVDTLRPDFLTSYGYDIRNTDPFLDGFWKQHGVLFDRAYSTSSWTTPSVASIMTSQYPAQHGVDRVETMILRDELLTLPEILEDDGYETAAFTASFLITASLNFSQGYQAYYDFDHYMFHWDGDRQVVDGAAKWLSQTRRGPFFIYLHLINPHCPYTKGPLIEDFNQKYLDHFIVESDRKSLFLNALQALSFPDYPFSEKQSRTNSMLASYDSEIVRTDAAIKHLIDYMKSNNYFDNTLFIITSDHGDEFNEHGGFYHQHHVYNEVIQVPLIIAGDMIANPGRTISSPVSIIDIMPTILENHEYDQDHELQGLSLWPLISGDTIGDRCLFSELDDRGVRNGGLFRSVLTDNMRLIITEKDGKMAYELFDLEVDPFEQNNLAASNPTRVEAMKKLIDAYKADLKELEPGEMEKEVFSKNQDLLKSLGYID